jgi:hypothetical protein
LDIGKFVSGELPQFKNAKARNPKARNLPIMGKYGSQPLGGQA